MERFDSEEAILAREALQRMKRAVETMPPQCRHIFTLRRVHERSVEEIATELGLSVSAVEKHLGEAVASLACAAAVIEGGFERAAISAEEHLHHVERAAFYFVAQLDDASDLKMAEKNAWLIADIRNAIAYAGASAAWDMAASLRFMHPAPDHDETRPGEATLSREGQNQQ